MSGLFPAERAPRSLYEHQEEAIERLRESFRGGRHKRPMFQAPTGWGKTLAASNIVRMAMEKGREVTFCVPRIDLIDQTIEQFAADGITDVGVIQANHILTNYSMPVQVASVQTLIKRGFPRSGLVIIDEAHMAFDKIHEWMAMPEWRNVPFIGLSATPWTRGLGRHYDDLIIAGSTQQMIDAGYLSPFRVFAPSHPDLTGVKVRMGDYVESDLSKAMNKTALVADVVDTWLSKAEGRPTLVFAVDRAHAMHLQQKFEASGVKAGYQDAFTKPDERREIRRKFHSGEYSVVCNVGTLTTGVDWDVRCIVLARPTRSEILYTQIIGRGLRTAPLKRDCLILDHSDSTLKLGFVTDIHHSELHDGNSRPEAERKVPLPKECPSCHSLRPANFRTCPNCGFTATIQPKAPAQIDGQLEELGAAKKQKGSKKVIGKHVKFGDELIPLGDFYGELKRYASERGYKSGWASQKYKSAVGVWPNAYRYVPEREVSPTVRSWVKGQQIRWAKAQEKGDRYAHAAD